MKQLTDEQIGCVNALGNPTISCIECAERIAKAQLDQDMKDCEFCRPVWKDKPLEVAKIIFKFIHPTIDWGHSGTVNDNSWRATEDSCISVAKKILKAIMPVKEAQQ